MLRKRRTRWVVVMTSRFVGRRRDAGIQDKMLNMSYKERKKRLELYKMAGKAGWMREVVKGDKKSNSQKRRIAYLPPSHLRNIMNMLYNSVLLGVFLTTHCPDTTQDNFSFSAQVLGLDMPCSCCPLPAILLEPRNIRI